MPFIGKDWRSPGEAWVKTESLGWQRMKMIESQLHPGCHQSLTCSWPLLSQMGQHMANNCNNEDNTKDDSNNRTNTFRNSVSTSSDSNSSESSESSQSSSPISSPEKTLPLRGNTHHHIHPIAISSPYGKYFCTPHHLGSSGTSPNHYKTNTDYYQNTDAQLITRSLSKESVVLKNETDEKPQPKMRYNNSVSDFRISSNSTDQFYEFERIKNTVTSPSHEWNRTGIDRDSNSTSQSPQIRPMLLKNGFKIDDVEIPGPHTRSLESLNSNGSGTKENVTINTNCCCSGYAACPIPCISGNIKRAPHCRVSVRTREVVIYNTISEAFYSLDFCNAIHDIRRFNYICKLLHLMITQNLTTLSGCATKVLFTMLEQVAWEVSNNKRNIHILKNLLDELKIMIKKNYCWGRPIGSSLLWQQHFDTIQRISQMVDSIELSPPKTETKQTTFNDLPVEMVREILLRLNDYRDLINSAQASPVMLTMINSQHIWYKLCKYHFTEQQLKLAIENNHLFTKRGNHRNLKYARTVSSDGRTTFRNPVMHKTKSSSTRQQLEQTKNRRGSRSKDTPDESNSSHVTRTIKIFNSQGLSSTSATSKAEIRTNDQTNKRANGRSMDGSRLNNTRQPFNQENLSSNGSDHLSHEIDWERIFHQLRKKFDLKEEYADCLLLCRHCRCLFWKSFGHPCIKNEDTQASESQQNDTYPGLTDKNKDNSKQQNKQPSQHTGQSRPSVALLSRNFDNRTQELSQDISAENLPPTAANNQVRRRDDRNNTGNILTERRNDLPRSVNSNSNNDDSRQKVSVPKHVAISPQAFLKFFSL